MLDALLLLTAVILLSYAFYNWATANNDFFERRNIKSMKPQFLVGNTFGLYFRKYTADVFSKKVYNALPDEPIFGMFDFRVPQFVVRDPEAIKRIGVKDFDHFEDHRISTDETTDKLWGNTLLFMKGHTWRSMRATLSPAFTGSKMRQMFELVAECADDVTKYFNEKIENGERVHVEMKDLFSRFSNDVIASCAFGLKVNSFQNPENEFYLNGKILMKFMGFKQAMKILLVNKLPKVARAFNITIADGAVAKAFRNTILDTTNVRKKENIHRPDMIDIMMKIRAGTLQRQFDEKTEEEGFATVEESEVGRASVSRNWNDDQIVAQCVLFFAAGFDTSSTLMTFASHELASNPDIQQKLYEEILETDQQLGDKLITYDALQKMKYMDQVVSETLRKWPPGMQTDRVCVKDYIYDDGERKFNVEKGTAFMFPIYGIHHDEKYYPEPERFDPERFSDENKINIVSGTFIPFGIGPRNCIGSRFALMEVKAMLYYLLLNFSLEPNEQTQIPLKFQPLGFILIPEKGLNLELRSRKN